MDYYIHPTSVIDEKVDIGAGTKIWHFCHIQSGAIIGKDCSLGQNVNVSNNVKIGNGVKIQNNVSVYEGVELEDYVFCGKIKHKDAYDEIQGINIYGIQPVYEHGMLVDGVCSTYAHTFEKRICEDLGIKHMSVDGVGTTGHSWSLIYLPEEQRWGHFDMTMVKFYQDGWIKEHEPYMEQDWIAATTEEIFKMQPTRKIELINGKKDEKFPITKDNYEELNISKFESTILPEDIGRSTIDVQTEQKENAQAIVNQDVKKHELEENQREGVSIDGE